MAQAQAPKLWICEDAEFQPRVPNDECLPALDLLRDQAAAQQWLQPVLANVCDDFRGMRVLAVSPVRHLGSKRCTVRLQCADVLGKQFTLFAKIYADQPDGCGPGAASYRNMCALRRQGFADGYLRIPEPIAYDSDRRVLIIAGAEGVSLSRLLSSSANVLPDIERCAHWLNKLHGCAIENARIYSFERHMHTLTLWRRMLSEACSEAQDVLVGIFNALARRRTPLAPYTLATVHRDFTPDHVILGQDAISVLDFDELCLYDPLFDVGHFRAHLSFTGFLHSRSMRSLDRASQLFWEAYADGRRMSFERMLIYEAISYVKLARFVLISQDGLESRAMVMTLLSAAHQLLV